MISTVCCFNSTTTKRAALASRNPPDTLHVTVIQYQLHTTLVLFQAVALHSEFLNTRYGPAMRAASPDLLLYVLAPRLNRLLLKLTYYSRGYGGAQTSVRVRNRTPVRPSCRPQPTVYSSISQLFAIEERSKTILPVPRKTPTGEKTKWQLEAHRDCRVNENWQKKKKIPGYSRDMRNHSRHFIIFVVFSIFRGTTTNLLR